MSNKDIALLLCSFFSFIIFSPGGGYVLLFLGDLIPNSSDGFGPPLPFEQIDQLITKGVVSSIF